MRPDVPRKNDLKFSNVRNGIAYTTGVKNIDLLCACNSLPCDGICRSTHLYRKRKDLDRCPSAYEKESKHKKFKEKKEKQIRDKKWRRQHDE